MTLKSKLRLISFIMLTIAVMFVLCALSAPNLGSVFWIGPFRIGVEVWRAFYALYAAVTAALFIASCFIRCR